MEINAIRTSSLAAFALGFCGITAAQGNPTAIAPAFPLTPDAHYGSSVAMADGFSLGGQVIEIVVVGAPGQALGGVSAGAVTVSVWDGANWVPSSLPTPPSLDPGARFGQSVAITRHGHWIAVGAPNNGENAPLAGSVYVYLWNDYLHPTPTFELAAELHGIFEAGFFGQALDLTGTYLAVGEPGALFATGTVNVFTTGTWQNVAFTVGENFLDAFGSAVELAESGSGTDLFVGAPFHDGSAQDAGRLYHFPSDLAWSLTNTVDGVQAEEHFGISIDARENFIFAGSPEYDAASGLDAGSVLQMTLNGTALFTDGRLVGLSAGERLGHSTAFSPNANAFARILAGAPNASASGFSAGLVRGGNTSGSAIPAVTSWTAPGAKSGDEHGFALACPEGFNSLQPRVLVGAPFNDEHGSNAGAATLYTLDAPGDATDLGSGLPGTGGAEPDLSGQGVFEPGTQLTLDFNNAQADSAYVLVVGFSEFDVPFFGGTLVPTPDILLPLATDANGASVLEFLLPSGVSGYRLVLQSWGPDAGGVQGLASSNAIAVDVGS